MPQRGPSPPRIRPLRSRSADRSWPALHGQRRTRALAIRLRNPRAPPRVTPARSGHCGAGRARSRRVVVPTSRARCHTTRARNGRDARAAIVPVMSPRHRREDADREPEVGDVVRRALAEQPLGHEGDVGIEHDEQPRVVRGACFQLSIPPRVMQDARQHLVRRPCAKGGAIAGATPEPQIGFDRSCQGHSRGATGWLSRTRTPNTPRRLRSAPSVFDRWSVITSTGGGARAAYPSRSWRAPAPCSRARRRPTRCSRARP